MALNTYEKDYKELLKDVLDGEVVQNRNQDTFTKFACQISADMAEGFPMLTGRKMFSKNTKHELKWMLNGDTNTKYLKENGVNIWDLWSGPDGDLGPIYGKQMRDFCGIDQISWVIEEMKNPVRSRRGVVSLWNPKDLAAMKLPPCHYSFNLVDINGSLNMAVTMRSLDLFIGMPYDMAFYALMLQFFCNELNKTPGTVTITAADCHIYTDHKEACLKYIDSEIYNLPELVTNKDEGPLTFKTENIQIKNYKSNGHIKAKVHE